MKNLLTVEILNSNRPTLKGYAEDFANDCTASDSGYICDAVSEFADTNTSIYYADIINFISENVEAVNDAIVELGWDGCGSDLYKAGQAAEYMQIEREIYDNLSDIIINIAFDYIINNDYNIEGLDSDALVAELSDLDNNNRFDDIADCVESWRENGEAVKEV